MKRALAVLALLLAVALFAGTVYFLWAKSRKPATVYEIESPQTATIIKKAVATGSVVPRHEVAIKPRVSGIVEEVAVEAGQLVRAGSLIARIRLVPDLVSLNEARNRRTRAEIALDLAEKDYRRSEALAAGGLIAEATFQELASALADARAELAAARNNVDLIEKGIAAGGDAASNTLVRSTIAGMVLEVPIEVGNSVIETNTFNEGTTLATIADMDDMIFEGRVDESEVGKLEPGMTLLLTVGAVEGREFEATLEHIAPKGVAEEGAIQFQIRAALQTQSAVLIRANYSANADIVLDRRDRVLAINESWIEFDEDKKFVQVETAPQEFERREIVTGLSDGILIEVVSGLTATDRIRGQPAPAGAPD